MNNFTSKAKYTWGIDPRCPSPAKGLQDGQKKGSAFQGIKTGSTTLEEEGHAGLAGVQDNHLLGCKTAGKMVRKKKKQLCAELGF